MIIQSLKLLAMEILYSTHIPTKVRMGKIVGEYIGCISGNSVDQVQYSEIKNRHLELERSLLEKYPEFIVPEWPARDPELLEDPLKEQRMATVTDPEEKLFLILDSAIIDVEINAMEASSALFIMDELHQPEFYKDFGSHIYDEALHAEILKDLLSHFPHFSSSQSYSNRVWKKVSKGKDILERIMIENVAEEGWAADKTVRLIQELKFSYPQISEAFELINKDEIRHAAIGNKWAMKFLNQNEEQFLELFNRVATSESHRIESIKTRLASGFSPKFIKKFF